MRRTSRPGCQSSMTRWSAGSPTRVCTTSRTSTRNRWASSGWPPPPANRSFSAGSSTSTARPASLASPGQVVGSSGGSREALCSARRGSRRRSRALRDPSIMPSHSSPSAKVASIPLIRGDPSRRRVASSLCLWASKAALARPANWGAAASISFQLAMTSQSTDPEREPGQLRRGRRRCGNSVSGNIEPMTEGRTAPGGPTVQRMLVGTQLRRLRIDAGLSREQAGEAIRASEWKIHRLENGQVGFKDRDIIDLLRLYGVTDPTEVAEFVALAREANSPGWWQHYGDVLPPWFRTYVDLESVATLIRTYEGQFIPGLLQTDDYMRAVVQGAHLDESSEEVGRRVRLRMARQTLLTREQPPRLWAVVDEAALRRPVGGPEVMRAQLERLLEAAKLPNVTLQILPFAAGAHAAMVGSFSILRFGDQELPDVVYLEHLTSALYLNKPEEVDQYLHVMEGICVRAAPPERTVELLERTLDEL